MQSSKLVTFALGTLIVMSAMAQNKPAGNLSPEEAIQNVAELGPGVHKVKVDNRNVFKSCVVVGQARISTVLGASKGMATARRNAKLKAESEFVSWLKTNTSSVRSFGDEVEFSLKGDGKETVETGKATETNIETITSSAQGAIRGLTLIGSHTDAENKMLTLVYAWKPNYARIADQIEAAMKPEPKSPPKSDQGKDVKSPEKAPAVIKEKTVTAPEATEFL